MTGPAAWRLSLVSALLRRDGVIAYPTEGVWGLGCLPASEAGVARILDLKRRSWQQGLLLVAADITQFEPYLAGVVDDRGRQQLDAAWPGPVTFLVRDNGVAPAWIVGEHDTLGLRVSAHPVVRALCAVTGPLVSTSANPSGRPAATSALTARRYFQTGIDDLVPGRLGGRQGPSEIRVLETGEVVR